MFLAGACPLDGDGVTVAPGDVGAQASRCVTNLVTALESAGASLGDVLYTRVLVATTSRDDLVATWTVVRRAFSEYDVPSTLLGVTVLGYPDKLVECEPWPPWPPWPPPHPTSHAVSAPSAMMCPDHRRPDSPGP